MGNLWKNCFRSSEDPKQLRILILGLSNSGKTEIGHILTNVPRDSYERTNGAKLYTTTLNNCNAKLFEIGGNTEMRKIWTHYYAKAMGIIFVVDASDKESFPEAFDVFQNLVQHNHIRGKPIVFLANKSDLVFDDFNISDFCQYFQLEELANRFQSHILLQLCGPNDSNHLFAGFSWLLNHINLTYNMLSNRVKFDQISVQNKRPTCLCKLQKDRENCPTSRPSTAPIFSRRLCRRNNRIGSVIRS